MNTARTIALLALLGTMSVLPACGSNRSDAGAKQEEKSVIRAAVDEAIVEARQEIREGNISVSGGKDSRKAEISPKGDLLIDGRAIAINADQRALLLDYRAHIAGVAESGMEIGAQGADLATKAMGEAFKGILSGKSEQEIEARVEAEAVEIKMAAAKLCARLPALMASQQKVAAAVPEFKPYATMTQEDIDDCLDETDEKETASRNAAERAAAAAAEAPTKSN